MTKTPLQLFEQMKENCIPQILEFPFNSKLYGSDGLKRFEKILQENKLIGCDYRTPQFYIRMLEHTEPRPSCDEKLDIPASDVHFRPVFLWPL